MALTNEKTENVVNELKSAEAKAEATVKKAAKETAAAAKKATKATAETAKKAAKATAETAKKAASTAKKAVKSAEKKATKKADLILQFAGAEYDVTDVAKRAEEAFKATGSTTTIKSLKVYLKPEDRTAYYVVNETITGSFAL